jgi:hypothetical protein
MAEDLLAVLSALTAHSGLDTAPSQTPSAAPAPPGHDRGAFGDGVAGSQSEAWASHLTGWSGHGSEQFRAADEALMRARRDREDIDRELAEALRDAGGAAGGSLQRLRAIEADVQAARQGLGPSLDTQAGRQQYAELLQSSIAEVQTILAQAQESHGRAVTALTAVSARYGSTAL